MFKRIIFTLLTACLAAVATADDTCPQTFTTNFDNKDLKLKAKRKVGDSYEISIAYKREAIITIYQGDCFSRVRMNIMVRAKKGQDFEAVPQLIEVMELLASEQEQFSELAQAVKKEQKALARKSEVKLQLTDKFWQVTVNKARNQAEFAFVDEGVLQAEKEREQRIKERKQNAKEGASPFANREAEVSVMVSQAKRLASILKGSGYGDAIYVDDNNHLWFLEDHWDLNEMEYEEFTLLVAALKSDKAAKLVKDAQPKAPKELPETCEQAAQWLLTELSDGQKARLAAVSQQKLFSEKLSHRATLIDALALSDEQSKLGQDCMQAEKRTFYRDTNSADYIVHLAWLSLQPAE